jgi:hypothetical protein
MGLLNSCRKIITFVLGRRYRPELHYMRGPGPKWSERHGAIIRPIPTTGSPLVVASSWRMAAPHPWAFGLPRPAAGEERHE